MFKQMSKSNPDYSIPLVLEVGEFSTKAGLAGAEFPDMYENTVR